MWELYNLADNYGRGTTFFSGFGSADLHFGQVNRSLLIRDSSREYAKEQLQDSLAGSQNQIPSRIFGIGRIFDWAGDKFSRMVFRGLL